MRSKPASSSATGVLVALGMSLAACASGPRPAAVGAGAGRGLTLRLQASDGDALPLPDGRSVLLFMFATFDDASQIALAPLIEVHRDRPNVRVIGIALQPDPGPMLTTYGRALDIDFPLAIEPDGTLLSGDSALGGNVTVPMFVALDSQGAIVETFLGVPRTEDLHTLFDAAQ